MDDFFALGGHSLSATRVTSRIRECFQIELSILAIFDAPTVAKLSEKVQAEMALRNERDSVLMHGLAAEIRGEIEEMPDDDVAVAVAELEQELSGKRLMR